MNLISLNRRKRLRVSELNTRVVFYEYIPDENSPYPDDYEYKKLYSCWAKVDTVWMKDIEVAKANGTLSDLTIVMRDPRSDFIPTNKHYIEIDAPEYRGKHYNVKHVQPDMQEHAFINVIAGLSE